MKCFLGIEKGFVHTINKYITTYKYLLMYDSKLVNKNYLIAYWLIITIHHTHPPATHTHPHPHNYAKDKRQLAEFKVNTEKCQYFFSAFSNFSRKLKQKILIWNETFIQ